MSANRLGILETSAGQEERHHRCAMDPNPAQLWIVGEFVSTRRGVGGIAHVAASSRAVVGTSRAARVAHAKGVVTNECAIITSLERRDRRYGAGDHTCDCSRRT